MSKFPPTDEQQRVLNFNKQNLIVSASAGSGKTSTLIEFIAELVEKGQPLKRILLLTFTKAAASEMKEKLLGSFYEMEGSDNIQNAIDDITTADISTIHSFLERLIKKNTNILPIEDGFSILNDDEAEKLKLKAFEQSEKEFKLTSKNRYENLFLRMHNDRNFIYQMMKDMSSFFACQTNPIQKIKHFQSSQKKFYDDAIKYVEDEFVARINVAKEKLAILKCQLEDEKLLAFAEDLSKAVNINKSGIELCKAIDQLEIKNAPALRKCDQICLANLRDIVGEFKDIKKELKALSLQNDAVYNREKFGEFENTIYDFYLLFEEKYSALKVGANSVDYNDLEKYAGQVLKNVENLTQIQSDYDYIFVDEYQDTNYVQEALIKDIATKAHFIAVGDPKQGIYGFRNATSDIIKRDIKDFSQSEDSSAEFLRKNFRSDPVILDFVNNIFVNVMKDETVGIDYEGTSMLKAGDEKSFVCDENMPSVMIDVVKQEKEETEEQFAPLYNILEDDALKVSSKSVEAKVIATRIEKILLGRVYDSKSKQFRNITYKDIVILFRGKSDLIKDVIAELSLRNIPVVSTIKGNFKAYSEILVLINLFKILLDEKDDVALASVMLSQIGGFTVDELAKIKLKSKEKELYNIVQNSDEEKVVKFRKFIEEQRFVFDVKGAYIMLQMLFDKTEFREYVLAKDNAENEFFVLESFLLHIKNSAYNFSLASLVKYLEQDEIDYKGGGNSENAVSICTIHSSKGLEYPVVVLAETGKSILRANNQRYVFNNDYGFAIMHYSLDDDDVYMTPLVYMLKSLEQKRARIDEMMLLYVALTRAKNLLYISGTLKPKDFETEKYSAKPFEANSFMMLMLSAYKKLMTLSPDELLEKRISFNIIDECENAFKQAGEIVSIPNNAVCEKLNEYFNFKYPYDDATRIVYKNTVSALNETSKRDVKSFGTLDNEFIERGNAYHLALKLLDFDKISSLQNLSCELEKLKEYEQIKKYIDCEILLDNILLLKSVLPSNGKIFKEKEFTSLINLKEINDTACDEEIMLQGAVDLFAIGEKNVLVDYKFSNDRDENSLKNRYKTQLYLYKNAIEKAYNIRINNVYLLSLKYSKLINF